MKMKLFNLAFYVTCTAFLLYYAVFAPSDDGSIKMTVFWGVMTVISRADVFRRD